MKREKYIRGHCKLVTIWECSFYNLLRVDTDLQCIVNNSKPAFYKIHKGGVSPEQILRSVKSGLFYGFVECDIHVDCDMKSERSADSRTKYEYMEELCPLYGTVDISYDVDISGVMKTFVDDNHFSKAPQTQLAGTMVGKKIIIHSDLLKFYLELGLSDTYVYQAIEYKGNSVFKPFADLIIGYRKDVLRDSDMKPIAQMYQTLRNSEYGSLLMNKFNFRDIHYYQGEYRAFQMVNCKTF